MEPPPPPLACAACLGDDAPASPLGACGHALCADCGASALRVGLEELATAGVALPPSGAAVVAAAPANKTAGNDNDDDDDDDGSVAERGGSARGALQRSRQYNFSQPKASVIQDFPPAAAEPFLWARADTHTRAQLLAA